MPTTIVKTEGIAPKVLLPFITLVVVGLALVVVGVVLDEPTLRELGLAVHASARGGGAIGYRAPPAVTTPTVPQVGEAIDLPSDARLSPEARAHMPESPSDDDEPGELKHAPF